MPQPGMNPQMQKMMRQAQKMQQDMMAAQEALKHEEVTVSSGGGMVSVTATGEGEIKAIKIDPAAVDPDDVDMLNDLVLAAVTEALRTANQLASEKMNQATGGLDLGALGNLGLPGF
ncbi:MAG TPA: YbaB/EbfC family nucleoid-associated protein [Solirubrobacteraceae bacterium]|jgi:hypothetical protein|nr:YbaB/EbfC family nucleoid-associated protein [Solirubrobacteraceae bacterium]